MQWLQWLGFSKVIGDNRGGFWKEEYIDIVVIVLNIIQAGKQECRFRIEDKNYYVYVVWYRGGGKFWDALVIVFILLYQVMSIIFVRFVRLFR